MLSVAADSDAVKDASGQYLPPVCIHLLLLHVHALVKQFHTKWLSIPPCHLVVRSRCLLQVSNNRDFACSCLLEQGRFCKVQMLELQTQPATTVSQCQAQFACRLCAPSLVPLSAQPVLSCVDGLFLHLRAWHASPPTAGPITVAGSD